jgi:hypothetical protein
VTVLFSVLLLAATKGRSVGLSVATVTTVAVKKVHQWAHEKNNKWPVLKHVILMPTPQVVRRDDSEEDVKYRFLIFSINVEFLIQQRFGRHVFSFLNSLSGYYFLAY